MELIFFLRKNENLGKIKLKREQMENTKHDCYSGNDTDLNPSDQNRPYQVFLKMTVDKRSINFIFHQIPLGVRLMLLRFIRFLVPLELNCSVLLFENHNNPSVQRINQQRNSGVKVC